MHNVLLFLIYKFVWPSFRLLIEILKHWYRNDMYIHVYMHTYKKKTLHERLSSKKKFHFKFRSLDYDLDVLCKSLREK